MANLNINRNGDTLNRIDIIGCVMNSVFRVDKLNISTINAQSLTANSKMQEFRMLFKRTRANIVVVSETWATKKVSDSDISLAGFKCYRHDRSNKRGGGLAVYVLENILCAVIEKSPKSSKTEYIFLELHLPNAKILLCAFYNPPKVNCIELLEEKFRLYSQKYDDIIITGDLNKDYLSSTSNNLRSLFNSFGIRNHVNAPTHFTSSSATTIDYLASCTSEKVLGISQIDYSSFSWHDILFCCFDYHVQQVKRETYQYRNYNRFCVSELETCINGFNWNNYFMSVDSDVILSLLNEKLKIIHDAIFPLRTSNTKYLPCPWFNESIKKSILERELAYRHWRSTKNREHFNLYKKLRNKTNTLFRDAKNRFLLGFLNPEQGGKVLWKRLEEIGVKKSKNRCNVDFSANAINEYFIDSVPSCSPKLGDVAISSLSETFSFCTTNYLDIFKALDSIKSNAVGLDGIPLKFLKIIYPFLCHQFEHLFNFIILTKKFPEGWKTSKVIPIPKKSNSSSISNLRPISILPTLSKAFEIILKNQLLFFIKQNRLLSDFQSGYRNNHSTTTAVLKIVDDISVSLDNKKLSILVLLDFSKAFDSLNHDLLCEKLTKIFKFSESATALTLSYLTTRRQKVFVNDIWSSPKNVVQGVPQGSILGPLLFSMFINDISNCLNYSKFHMFADDIQIYCSANKTDVTVLCNQINTDLSSILQWSLANGLPLNVSKTNALFISRSSESSGSLNLNLGNEVINVVTSVSNLGFSFEKNLSWDSQVTATCGKIYGALRTLRRFSSLSQKMKLNLFKSLVLPFFNYGDVLFLSISEANKTKLNTALNDCIRFIYNLKLGDHVTHLQRELIGCPFSEYYKFRSNMFIKKLLITQEPGYLYEKLDFSNSSRTNRLIIPRNRTSFYNSSFFVQGVSIYNSLPNTIKEATSLVVFRKECLKFYNS